MVCVVNPIIQNPVVSQKMDLVNGFCVGYLPMGDRDTMGNVTHLPNSLVGVFGMKELGSAMSLMVGWAMAFGFCLPILIPPLRVMQVALFHECQWACLLVFPLVCHCLMCCILLLSFFGTRRLIVFSQGVSGKPDNV